MKIKNITPVNPIKIAMPVPMPTPQERRKMMDEGLLVSPHVPHAEHSKEELPSTGKKQLSEIVEQAASGLFNSLNDYDKKTVMQLPAIHQIDPDMMVNIDGENYYIVQINKSKTIGKKTVIDGVTYQKGDFYAGKIVCLKADNGDIVQFPFHETADRIQQPTENKLKIMQNVNKEIDAYNKKLENIEKSTHTSRLALQITSAEQDCNDRIDSINAMINAIEQKQNSPINSQGHAEWMQRLFEDVANRQMSLFDAFHTVSYQYQNNPEQLISDIENGVINVPNEIRQALIAMATQEARNKTQKFEDQQAEQTNRENRKNEEWTPEGGIEFSQIPPITQDDIPGGTIKRLPSYSRPENLQSQTTRQLFSLNQDLREITTTKNALSNLRKYVGELEKGQRTNEFLSSQEGQPILQEITSYLNDIKQFVKRYKTNVFENGKLNPKLFGTSGKAIGNALLAVSLNKILNVIYETIKPFIQSQEPIMAVPSQTSPVQEQRVPVESFFNNSNKITKLAMKNDLWNTFINIFSKN